MSLKKILIIDDEPLLLKSTALALKVKGFDAETANSGKTGIEIAIKKQPKIILLDIMMPGQSGFEVLKLLKQKEETKHIPVIMFSAKHFSHNELLSKAPEAVAYVFKPFNIAEVVNTIRRNLNELN